MSEPKFPSMIDAIRAAAGLTSPSPSPSPIDDLLRQFGEETLRKALGFYISALHHTNAGGVVIFRKGASEKTWKPKP